MRYVPILQSKEGEIKALSRLAASDKAKIRPLIQLLPDTKLKRKGDYISERVKSIVDAWSFFGNRIFFDGVNINSEPLLLTERFFTESRQAGINVIPVIYPNTSIDRIKFYSSQTMTGVCLRISANDLTAETINEAIVKIELELGLKRSEIDLLIDFSYITPSVQTHFFNSFKLVYPAIAGREELRSIIIASGSFPSMLSGIPKGSVMPIPRIEWALWNQIRKVSGTSSLIYSDYGNAHPVYDPDQAERRGTCSIKYTDLESYYIFKGVKASDSPIGNEQYREKAKDLITRPFYAGSTFSWGDQYILDCADTREGPGSPATWVQVTQNHHFVKTLALLETQT